MSNFVIVNSQLVNARFKALCEKARAERRLVGALLAIKELLARLQDDPHALGELQYHLKSVGFPARHVAIRPWSVHFAIDDQRKHVHVGKISLLG